MGSITTTSGYTWPVASVPTTQSPTTSGHPDTLTASDMTKYSSWNGDWLGYLNYLADHGDKDALDRLLNYAMSESSTQSQRDWDAHAYSRMFEDMKSVGVNPYWLFSGGGSPVSSATNTHYSGAYSSSYEINKEKNNQNWLKIALSSFIPIIGGIIAAFL